MTRDNCWGCSDGSFEGWEGPALCSLREIYLPLTLSLPTVAKGKIQQKCPISFRKILKNKYNHVKAQAEMFHLNGHSRGFCPQTQKWQSGSEGLIICDTPSLILFKYESFQLLLLLDSNQIQYKGLIIKDYFRKKIISLPNKKSFSMMHCMRTPELFPLFFSDFIIIFFTGL